MSGDGHPDGENYASLHERVLIFMGEFSSVQFTVDTAIAAYIKSRLPTLWPVMKKQFFDRIRDDQRVLCFLAFVEESGYEGDLSEFAPRFRRAAATRNLVGHGLGVTGPAHSPDGSRSVAIPSLTTKARKNVPNPLLPSTFDALAAECSWMSDHALRAMYEAKVANFLDLSGAPSEPAVPSSKPVGGLPI